MIEAKVICDSVSPRGYRLTTFWLRYPKYIHGEFMTHRMLSRNASSSRAVPSAKLIEEVRTAGLRVSPIRWEANKPGMQAGADLDDTDRIIQNPFEPYGPKLTALEAAKVHWDYMARTAADEAEELFKIGLHKQWANRIIEPFVHINVVATATEWNNFFGLRLHKDAQPEMQALAVAMWEARKASVPTPLQPGEWHLPFLGDEDLFNGVSWRTLGDWNRLIKMSVARCARTSYTSFETGKRSTPEEDIKFYHEKLHLPDVGDLNASFDPVHASPAEHQATPDPDCYHRDFAKRKHVLVSPNRHEWGNFVGWRQYRKLLPGEAVAPLPEEFS